MPLIPPTAYNALMGLFRPQAAPAGASAYDQALAQARSNALGQFGMGLVAAAIPQTAAQRVQSLQGAIGALKPDTTDVYNQAQARLMFQKMEDDKTSKKAMTDYLTGATTPAPVSGNMANARAMEIAATNVPTSGPIVAPQNKTSGLNLKPDQAIIVNGLMKSGRVEDAYNKAIEFQAANAAPVEPMSDIGKILADPTIPQDVKELYVNKKVAPEGFRVETNPQTGEVSIVQGSAPPPTNKTGAALLPQYAKSRDEAMKLATSAARDIDTTNELRGLIDSGVNFGQAGGVYNYFNTQLANLGIVNENGETLNTKTYAAVVGNRVGEIIKQFGSGTGLSNADRDFAMKIAGADPASITEDQARKLLTIADKVNRATISRYNKAYYDPLAEAAKTDPLLNMQLPAYAVEMPPEYVPIPRYDANGNLIP